MSPALRKGLLVAALHVAIVASLGAKLVIDRATRPRVWARTAPVDPNLPIRGRYVRLRLEAAVGEGLDLPARSVPITLAVQDQKLVALPVSGSSGVYARAAQRDGRLVAVLEQPLAYFIPEHVPDPSRRAVGEELWVEITIPRRGAPRPIRLGVKKDGVLSPLDMK